MSKSKNKILIKMTGSIACFKACGLISKLVQAGHDVQVVASKSALQFVGAATLEGLTGHKVVSDLWEPGEAMAHIHLMRWADLIVVVPASAHFINRIAGGVGDDLLTTLFLAHDFKKPYLIAPAMNTSMYLHPVTQKSLTALKGMGLEILEAASGVLACGEVGYGRLLEPELLQNEIEVRLAKEPGAPATETPARTATAPFRVLVTGGGTRESIDGVRVLTNLSTGRTGAALVDALNELGFAVTWVHAQDAARPRSEPESLSFVSSDDLARVLRERLARGDVNAVIHLAAVSDFVLRDWEQNGQSFAANGTGKISSSADLTLHLTRNRKIVSEIRDYSPKPLHLTAFKMTSGASPEAVQSALQRLADQSHPDLIVHNDTHEIRPERGEHPLHLYRHPREKSQTLNRVAELATELAREYGRLS